MGAPCSWPLGLALLVGLMFISPRDMGGIGRDKGASVLVATPVGEEQLQGTCLWGEKPRKQ